MKQEKSNSHPESSNAFWSFFSSVKLAIALLAVIAVASILGTLIPQGDEAAEFTRRLSPGVLSFMKALQLFDVFHSIWFLLLMGLLSLNLIVCSLKRLPATMRLYKTLPPPDRPGVFEGLPAEQVLLSERKIDDEAASVESLLRGKFKRVQRRDAEKGVFLYGEKGAFSHFGVYVIHLSVLVIIAGMVIGSLFGIEGFVKIPEGGSVDTLVLKGHRGEKALGFTVRCDRFVVEFYPNGMPSEFRSELAFLENGRVAQQESLRVNHPVEFGGLRFYQANYGAEAGRASIAIRGPRGELISKKAGAGESFEIPLKKATVQVLRLEENLMNMGPAVKVQVRSGEQDYVFWVFEHIREIMEANPGILQQVPLFNPGLFKPYVFGLEGIENRYYTGLQVSQDPGVPVVAAGSFLMVFGFLITFFTSRRQIWVKLDRGEKGKTRVSVAGRSSKDPVGLSREMKRFLEEYKKRGSLS